MPDQIPDHLHTPIASHGAHGAVVAARRTPDGPAPAEQAPAVTAPARETPDSHSHSQSRDRWRESAELLAAGVAPEQTVPSLLGSVERRCAAVHGDVRLFGWSPAPPAELAHVLLGAAGCFTGPRALRHASRVGSGLRAAERRQRAGLNHHLPMLSLHLAWAERHDLCPAFVALHLAALLRDGALGTRSELFMSAQTAERVRWLLAAPLQELANTRWRDAPLDLAARGWTLMRIAPFSSWTPFGDGAPAVPDDPAAAGAARLEPTPSAARAEPA